MEKVREIVEKRLEEAKNLSDSLSLNRDRENKLEAEIDELSQPPEIAFRDSFGEDYYFILSEDENILAFTFDDAGWSEDCLRRVKEKIRVDLESALEACGQEIEEVRKLLEKEKKEREEKISILQKELESVKKQIQAIEKEIAVKYGSKVKLYQEVEFFASLMRYIENEEARQWFEPPRYFDEKELLTKSEFNALCEQEFNYIPQNKFEVYILSCLLGKTIKDLVELDGEYGLYYLPELGDAK